MPFHSADLRLHERLLRLHEAHDVSDNVSSYRAEISMRRIKKPHLYQIERSHRKHITDEKATAGHAMSCVLVFVLCTRARNEVILLMYYRSVVSEDKRAA